MSERRTSEESLRELLTRVHERLGDASVDAESRKLLATLVRDIDRALGRGGARKAASTHAHRLESLAVRFEADHPALAEVIREVIDALVKVGI
ncbi:MAG TPA: DUF4404 family protein [Steroidobacteraceae bacterium]|nr:DUF4404 family protein [Steroidobacteraceae bacterium]